ncbi:MAG: hypothetical protein RL161_1124, partial [Bacteroidota bacterium]
MKVNSRAIYWLSIWSILVFSPMSIQGKDPYPVDKNLDVLHYTFHLNLNDSTDIITGRTELTVQLLNGTKSFEIDLVGQKPDGTGMSVTS